MNNPKTHTCSDCGYVWQHGQHGGHSCTATLLKQLATQNNRIAEYESLLDELWKLGRNIETSKEARDLGQNMLNKVRAFSKQEQKSER